MIILPHSALFVVVKCSCSRVWGYYNDVEWCMIP